MKNKTMNAILLHIKADVRKQENTTSIFSRVNSALRRQMIYCRRHVRHMPFFLKIIRTNLRQNRPNLFCLVLSLIFSGHFVLFVL